MTLKEGLFIDIYLFCWVPTFKHFFAIDVRALDYLIEKYDTFITKQNQTWKVILRYSAEEKARC